MKSLYLDCETGISGDMIVAMLLDLGAREQALYRALAGIQEEGFSIKISRVIKSGIDCCDFAVILDHENHDHDMDYLYGHERAEEISGHAHHEAHMHEGHAHGEHHHEEHHAGHVHGEHYHEEYHNEHVHGEHHHKEHYEGHVHGEHHHEKHHDEHVYGEHHHEKHYEGHVYGEHTHGEHHHEGHEHPHIHRNYVDIVDIIEHLDMTDRAKSIAKKTFRILAEAEAKAHAKKVEEVHFHEVGAIDSIVDIVAAAVCFDDLDISQVIVRRICEGQGSVRCQHGILQVPVPAVIRIAESCGLPISITNRRGELITPTGAAFVAAVMTGTEPPEILIPKKTGMGAGKRAYSRPSVLRGILFESMEDRNAGYQQETENNGIQKGNTGCQQETENNGTQKENTGCQQEMEHNGIEKKNIGCRQKTGNNGTEEKDTIWKLETNIDDCTGEQLGFVMEKLMAAGARDVYYTPVYMKKNRPAWLLSVITSKEKISELEDLIFTHTTTIGIRRQEMERTVLPRSVEEVQTKYGVMQVKVCRHGDREKRYPEYESAVRLSKETGATLADIYLETRKAFDADQG